MWCGWRPRQNNSSASGAGPHIPDLQEGPDAPACRPHVFLSELQAVVGAPVQAVEARAEGCLSRTLPYRLGGDPIKGDGADILKVAAPV